MDEETLKTAIHEAGHAVAFARLLPDRIAGGVSIEPDGERLGLHSAEELTVSLATPDADADQIFEAQAVYCCAGYAALIAAGYPEAQAVEGCGSDFEEAGPRLQVGKARAVALMQLPENRRAVSRLAQELVARRRLAGDHAQVLIDVADGHSSEAEYQVYLQIVGL